MIDRQSVFEHTFDLPAVPDQTVSFLLEPTADGTRLTFVHAGFVRTADRSDYQQGWAGFLDALVRTAAEVT